MKIPDANFQMVSIQCANFLKNPSTHLLENAWTKSCPQMGDRQTDGQTNRRTDGLTNRPTDRQGETNIPPKLRLLGINIVKQ